MTRRSLHHQMAEMVAAMVDGGIRMDEAVQALEAQFLREVLDRNGGNQSKAATQLGMHRNTLRNKMRHCRLP